MTGGDLIRLGFLYPVGYGDQEYYRFGEALGDHVRVYLLSTRLWGNDRDHVVESLLRSGDVDHLASAAGKFRDLRPRSIMWACTSASFVGGVAWAEAQVAAIGRVSGRPAGSTSLAFVDALNALRLERAAVMATYPPDVAARFEAFLSDRGKRVVNVHTLGIPSGWDTPMSAEQLGQALRRADHPDAQALLIPDTALPTLDVLDTLERDLGKPLLSANQVTIWKGMRLAGMQDRPAGFGSLFQS